MEQSEYLWILAHKQRAKHQGVISRAEAVNTALVAQWQKLISSKLRKVINNTHAVVLL